VWSEAAGADPVWKNGGMVSPNRTIEATDHDTGAVVGTVTVPDFAPRRLWKESVRITWSCTVADCGAKGVVDHNATPEDAYMALMAHCWGDHAIIVLPRDLGVK
jgi:hypothetical protein